MAITAAALMSGVAAAFAADFVEPPVFASSNGVLDLLMIAQPQPIPSISYVPPSSNRTINPVGWVYAICPRSAALPGNQCPAGAPTVADYGGVRLALQKGDQLKIRLVNRLPLLNQVKVNHSVDPGGANLPLNVTNLHTHGLLVQARAPTLHDPTFGDYVFVDIYNSANGTPVPQATHQHGSLVKDFADYRIDIPANHPSGAFWFHPHIHGLSLNQVSSGLSGIISVGSAGDYAFAPGRGTPFPEGSIRHLILKDLQVLAGNPVQRFANGNAAVADGEVLNQQASPFCAQFPPAGQTRYGTCPGLQNVAATWGSTGGGFLGGLWYFTVSGQVFPTINITEAGGELWRFTNASGSVTYDLQLINNATQTPMMMQLTSVDGISINIPPGTAPGSVVKLAGGRFRIVNCPASTPSGMRSQPVCIDQLVMMPSSRAEVWVIYRDQNGNVVAPPAGASATLEQAGITMGPVGDAWPQVGLANVKFTQTNPGNFDAKAIDVHGEALAAHQPGGIFAAAVPYAHAAPLPAGCKPLAPGHRRRIFFGLQDTSNPDVFGLGYEEVDQNGAVIPDTEVPVTAFDPSANTICIPLGPGEKPVTETWELVNLATENHNFHIHQTRFRYLENGAPSGSPLAPALDPSSGPGVEEDNVPLPVAVGNTSDVANYQNGYCTIAQWRDGECTSVPVVVQNTFTQLGQFVYHCHILAHEDGGMMGVIQVVASPSPTVTNTHDFNGDGKSDILWRDINGDLAMWLMSSAQVLSGGNISQVASAWSVVGQRDFNGDGKTDILWLDNAGNLGLWLMNGLSVSSRIELGNVGTAWSVAGTGDFDGDGKGDILWRDNKGNVAIWFMNGGTIKKSCGVGGADPAVWFVAGTGDFNGDGMTDILWRNASGDVAIWEMNGCSVIDAAVVANAPTAWSIAGTGDFNGDGKADILWRGTGGEVAIWLMNGLQVAQSSGVGSASTVWSVAETGDFNGDGVTDILWIDTGGHLGVWLMNGPSVSSYIGFGDVGTNWKVQGQNAD